MVIETDPDILGGKPVVKGTRIPVELVLELAELGYTPEQMVKYYPRLTEELILDVLKVAKIAHQKVSYNKIKRVAKI